ncbi:MAG: FKBP-type peptidyl-prolyl cis-trans isomerase [Firmicutes bacterium]|nr:FKBP-type peptidyl-prolyl cis-trans isomerase [Bacillota bacterium]
MKNTKRILLLCLCLVLAVSLLTGCKKKEEPTVDESFDYSRDLDANGMWKDIKALDIVTLPDDYAAIKMARAKVEPSESELEAEIDEILKSYEYTVDVTERAAGLYDTVDIDFEGRLADGTTVDGMSGNKSDLVLGSGYMIPGFEDAIVDAKAFAGDEFEIKVTFPDPYESNTDLSGKDAVFKIKVNAVSESIIPELTDAFVAEKYYESEGLMTVAEFKDALTDAMTEENFLAAIRDHVIDDSVYGEIPGKMMTFQQDANYYYYMLLVQSYATNYAAYGMSAQDWFEYLTYCTDKESFDEMNEDIYTDACKESLVMQAIAEKENITVTDDEVAEYFQANLNVDDYSEYTDYYGEGYIKMIVRNEKTLAWLYENASMQ